MFQLDLSFTTLALGLDFPECLQLMGPAGGSGVSPGECSERCLQV